MSGDLLISIIPFALAAMGAFLLLTRRNPWLAGISGSQFSLRWLRMMGIAFLLFAALFFWLGQSGRLTLQS